MAGNSLNLVELIQGYMSGGVTDKIASLFGENRDKMQSGMNAAVPGILSGLEGASSTPEGAQRLTNAVDAADDSLLSNIGGFLGKMSSSESGSGVISSILGTGAFSELASNLGRVSGLSGKGTMGLLGFLAPLVLGVLKNLKNTQGLDSAGLSSLLSSQSNNIAAAMPEGMPGRIGAAAEPSSVREGLRDLSRTASVQADRARETYREGREAVASRSRSWAAPIIVALGLIGLLWYWGSRPSTHAGGEPSSVAERTAAPGSLETLKMKYESVLNEAQTQGIQLSRLEERGGKLVIAGTAPTFEAANKVWDQIKRVNPTMDDIIADFHVH